MNFRTVTAALLLMTSVAVADDMTLEPVCAELAQGDELAPAEQAIAQSAFARALEEANLLVVTGDCTHHYRLSHTTENGDFIVRIVSPRTIRFTRNPDRHELAKVYGWLLGRVIDAEHALDVASVATRTEDRDEDEQDDEDDDTSVRPAHEQDESDTGYTSSSVKTDTTIFAQALAGTSGAGIGIGLRVPVSAKHALDLYTHGTESDTGSLMVLGAKLLTFTKPQGARSVYFGAGLAFGVEEKMIVEGASNAAGAQIESSVGVMFNRTEKFRVFLQADLDIPLYGSWVPTFIASVGAGG